MKARIAFVVEQALGHVAYGMGLKKALASRDDVEGIWIEVPYETGRFGRVPYVGPNWTLRGSARAWRLIRDAHRERPIDALFLHTQTVSLFAGPHMRRIPTLLSLDATPKNLDEIGGSYAHRVGGDAVEGLKTAAHRRVMRNARWFTTWSRWAKESLVRDYGAAEEMVTIIHPGTVLGNFPSPSGRPPRREGPLRVLFVGGDFVRKGGDLLLEVFRSHLRGRVELHLVTAAEIPPEAGVHVYRGLKPHSPELLARYRDADVFVLPTRGDCLAVVLGEAMAACLPIITTRVGAHPEAVEDGKSGYLLDVDDAGRLRESLERMAGDPGLVAELGQRSRRIGEERFDMHKNANQIADILVGLCPRRASADERTASSSHI